MRQAMYRKFHWFVLSALLSILFGSFIIFGGTTFAFASPTMAPNNGGIPGCTTTPNYTIKGYYSSIVGTVVLRQGYENSAGTSGFGYCHIVSEHGTQPLNVLAYVLQNGKVVSSDATSVTIQSVYPGDGKTYRILVVTSPTLGDGYSKGIITCYPTS